MGFSVIKCGFGSQEKNYFCYGSRERKRRTHEERRNRRNRRSEIKSGLTGTTGHFGKDKDFLRKAAGAQFIDKYIDSLLGPLFVRKVNLVRLPTSCQYTKSYSYV